MMNLLQSFMGCMYPDIIRTDSIESIEHDCRFQAANIDELGNENSRGELQLINDELIYYRPSKTLFRWPLDSIRRWGYIDEGHKFVFETGRKSPDGHNIYAFRLYRGRELVDKLNEKTRWNTRNHQQQQQSQPQHATTNGQQSNMDTSRDQDQSASQHSPTRSRQRGEATAIAETRTSEPSSQDGVRPLSYSKIDFRTTKALNESAQAHAASRDR